MGGARGNEHKKPSSLLLVLMLISCGTVTTLSDSGLQFSDLLNEAKNVSVEFGERTMITWGKEPISEGFPRERKFCVPWRRMGNTIGKLRIVKVNVRY